MAFMEPLTSAIIYKEVKRQMYDIFDLFINRRDHHGLSRIGMHYQLRDKQNMTPKPEFIHLVLIRWLVVRREVPQP